MLTINKQVVVSIGASLDRPQMRKVSFFTKNHHIFYLEFAMDKTEFIKLAEFEIEDDLNPDDIINDIANQSVEKVSDKSSSESDALLDELDI